MSKDKTYTFYYLDDHDLLRTTTGKVLDEKIGNSTGGAWNLYNNVDPNTGEDFPKEKLRNVSLKTNIIMFKRGK